MEPKRSNWLDAIIGLVVTALGGIGLIATQLLPYNDFTKRPLGGGGVFGLLVGTIIALSAPLSATTRIVVAVLAGIVGFGSTFGFQFIVEAEKQFTGVGFVLYALAFAIFGCLFFLATSLSTLIRTVEKKK